MIRQIDPAPLTAATRVMHVTTVPQTLSFLCGHIAHAKKNGLEVHALSSPGEALDTLGRDLGIDVHAVTMSRRITPLADLAALRQTIRVMRQVQPTIVHGHTPKGGLLAMLAARWCNVPVRIYHLHGLPLMTAQGMKRRILRATERMSCRLANQVFCLCNSLREVVLAERLCPPEKMKVLNHGNIDGIETEELFNPARLPADAGRSFRLRHNIPPDALVVGFAGRIVRDKGLIELVGAWKKLREEMLNVHLLVAGPFESEDPIPAEVEQILRTDPRIHLAGLVATRDMASLYQAFDLFVLPTYREGFGMVLLEASAMELPVVATRIPGCVDAVREGETGLLVPARDVDALAGAIRAYLGDAALRRRHGVQGRQRVVRDFQPEVMREALYQEYLRLMQDQVGV